MPLQRKVSSLRENVANERKTSEKYGCKEWKMQNDILDYYPISPDAKTQQLTKRKKRSQEAWIRKCRYGRESCKSGEREREWDRERERERERRGGGESYFKWTEWNICRLRTTWLSSATYTEWDFIVGIFTKDHTIKTLLLAQMSRYNGVSEQGGL